jgi:hypothetical protein
MYGEPEVVSLLFATVGELPGLPSRHPVLGTATTAHSPSMSLTEEDCY